MKKLIAVALLFAVIFCFAACSKNKGKGEIYVPPQTEVITFEDGLTAVFEVVTEENGEVATDAEGETKYIPYIPPVTEEGGYLVTDTQGSTIPDLPTQPGKNTAAGNNGEINVDTEIGEFDEPTLDSGKTEKPEKTTKAPTQQTTAKPQQGTTAKPSTNNTTAPAKPDGTTTKPSDTPTTEPVTEELDGTLTPAKAQKLVDLMEGVENPFDEDLAEADFHAAEKSIEVYIANIEAAIKEIKSDKALYQFVGNTQLDLWINNMYEAKDRYQKFMTLVEHEEGKTEKNPLYYKAYTDFQDAYRDSLEAYYFILFAAQDRT